MVQFFGLLVCSFVFWVFSPRCSLTLAQARVQWHNLDSLLPLPLGSSISSASAFLVAGITGTWLIFVFLVETGFCHVGQASGLQPLTSGDPPVSTSQSVGITGVRCHAHPSFIYYDS